MVDPIQFLLNNASPAIRFRTRTELLGGDEHDAYASENTEFIAYPLLQEWLGRLRPVTDFNSIHGSKPDTLENVSGKLNDLGFQSWMLPEFAEHFKPHLTMLEKDPSEHGLGEFAHQGLLNYLLVLGCRNETIRTGIFHRLDQLTDFTSLGIYDIYIDHTSFGAFPRGFHEKPLINPDYNNCLPLIWDIHALSCLPNEWRSQEVDQKIDAVIRYILDPRYQALPIGYGIMYHPPTKRYYAMGWSVHLPRHETFEAQPKYFTMMFIQRLELMTHFKAAQTHPWIISSLQHLDGFQTEKGTWQFPGEYLRERPSGYWVTGAYMRLEENHHSKVSLELDSTFRMCLMKHHLNRW